MRNLWHQKLREYLEFRSESETELNETFYTFVVLESVKETHY